MITLQINDHYKVNVSVTDEVTGEKRLTISSDYARAERTDGHRAHFSCRVTEQQVRAIREELRQ